MKSTDVSKGVLFMRRKTAPATKTLNPNQLKYGVAL